MNEAEVAQARAETPGCAQGIHLDNAGSSLMPAPVLDAVIAHLRLESEIGGYRAARRMAEQVDGTYAAIAGLLNCRPEEIALAESATRAWDMAFYSFRFEAGDRILTARAEYAGNAIAMLQLRHRTGVEIDVVPDDEHGQVDVAALEAMIDERVKLIAITHVPTFSGLVNPVADVGRVARSAGVPFLLDACQSAGQMALDVEAIGCDVLAATGRKYLRGPRGTGFLFVRDDLAATLEPPMLDTRSAEWLAADRYAIHPHARRFESWESDVAARLGLGTAAAYAADRGVERIEQRVVALAHRLRNALSGVDGVEVHDRGTRMCGIVTFTIGHIGAADVVRRLEAHDITVSASPPEVARFDSGRRADEDLVRASVHYFTTDSELDHTLDVVNDIARGR